MSSIQARRFGRTRCHGGKKSFKRVFRLDVNHLAHRRFEEKECYRTLYFPNIAGGADIEAGVVGTGGDQDVRGAVS